MGKQRKKKLKPDERYWELHVMPVRLSRKVDYESRDAIWKWRIENRERSQADSLLEFKMNYLRWQVAHYLKDNVLRQKLTFGHFLNEYIHRLGRDKRALADEISIPLEKLEGLLNDRILPDEDIFHRLAVHSNDLIKADQWHKMIDGRKRVKYSNDSRLLELARAAVQNPIGIRPWGK